ncbi:hypothetical protein B0H17DRAFT_1204101 [Mycena rosella]|uniref:Uncharacterized protein n=1 Tax=Mycena rosella TaxID=1033263 RepID=A0AAD7DA55_MYCRO|nr:hypothetical protein B0H17DRAFT_1204101 [Mycena rosella]
MHRPTWQRYPRDIQGGVRSEVTPLDELPPLADRQDFLPASLITSEAPSPTAINDPIHLAETLPITEECTFFEVTDAEVNRVILTSSPWKAPDRYSIQMGFFHHAWPAISEWVRKIFKLYVRLSTKPAPFKANVARMRRFVKVRIPLFKKKERKLR